MPPPLRSTARVYLRLAKSSPTLARIARRVACRRRASTCRSRDRSANVVQHAYASGRKHATRRGLIRQVLAHAMAVFLYRWAVDALVRTAVEIDGEFDLELPVNSTNFVRRPGAAGVGAVTLPRVRPYDRSRAAAARRVPRSLSRNGPSARRQRRASQFTGLPRREFRPGRWESDVGEQIAGGDRTRRRQSAQLTVPQPLPAWEGSCLAGKSTGLSRREAIVFARSFFSRDRRLI